MLDGRFRFEGFVAGPSNRLAVSAARAVAEAPGKVYHPLFIYAEPGLGKTHLLAALGFHASQVDPTLTVAYRSSEDYVEQLRFASQRGDLNAWRREWEVIGLLLLDDVQFLDGEAEAQAELLRLIDQAQGRGFQVVLASDRPPADLDGLDQRLLSRMSGGLIADIAAPEIETRLGILRLWRSARTLDLDDAALDELAGHEVGNVRELLGVFNRLVAQRSLEPGTPAAGAAKVVVAQARGERAAPDEFESFLNELAAVVTSSVEGVWKPDPGLFRIALERLDTRAEATVSVGDHLERDFETARVVGLQAILLDRFDDHPEITPRVRTLTELPSLFPPRVPQPS